MESSWDERYAREDTPWDTGRPSRELARVLRAHRIPPGRALELGCGTGTNAVYLAGLGFEVTATEISEVALERAREKARRAGVRVDFRCADVSHAAALGDLGPPFPFVFDRGVYHTVREEGLAGLLETLERVTAPGSLWLTLAGNAGETHPEGGPPTVWARELTSELERLFAIVELREFRFDEVPGEREPFRPLAWSALLRRR